MQPITISLDSQTHKLAKEKTNFSQWVRDKLRAERNQQEELPWKYCITCDQTMRTNHDLCPQSKCPGQFDTPLEMIE